MSTCAKCGTDLPKDEPKAGRPQRYCSTSCRQAAHRARKQQGTQRPEPPGSRRPLLDLTPPPPAACHTQADDIVMEIARDIQEEARHILRDLDASSDPTEPLRRIVHLGSQLECLTAGLVGHARHHRFTWRQIGKLLSISEDGARRRFNDEYILRRLNQRTRRQAGAHNLDALYGPSAPRTTQTPEAAQDDHSDPPRALSTPAYNRLAPVLSMLARASQLRLQDISTRIDCSPSYLSRMLNGERTPSWRLTERFARTCGADPAVLRKVWESERLRDKDPRGSRPEPDTAPPAPAHTRVHEAGQFLRALRTLHVRAGQPSDYDIAVLTRWELTPDKVTAILDGSHLPTWPDLSKLLAVLGGMHTYFRPLWQAAQHAPDQPTPDASS